MLDTDQSRQDTDVTQTLVSFVWKRSVLNKITKWRIVRDEQSGCPLPSRFSETSQTNLSPGNKIWFHIIKNKHPRSFRDKTQRI